MTTTDPRWLDAQEQAVWRDYVRMQGELNALLNRQLQESSELSLADFEVLVRLSEAGGDRVRAFTLANAMHWEKSRLSHQLTRMERRGLLERQSCPEDARGAFVVLTAEGRAALSGAAPAHVAEVRRLLFDVLTPAQVRALGGICAAVLTRLDDEGCSPELPG
jgi:DNA-binding MarR family transcriptional regulator